MVKFIMLIGPPGSGKSTWAKNYVQKMQTEESWHRFVILSSDEIRKELWGSDTDQRNPAAVFKLLNRRAYSALSGATSVIYDATNINKKNRKSVLDRMPDTDFADLPISKIAVVFETPLATCIARDASRDRVVGDKVISRYYNQFEMPTKEEGFGSIYKCKTENGLITFYM